MSELLLQTISTFGNMNIDKFNTAFNGLSQSMMMSNREVDLNYVRRQTIRLFDSLGHCDFDFDNRRVFACSPSLVALPTSGLPKAILTGARVPSLIKDIKNFVRTNRDSISFSETQQNNEYLFLPSAIYIEAVDYEYIKNVSLATQIYHYLETPVAWSLANFSVGIKNIMENLIFERRDDINWKKQTFSTDSLTFSNRNCDNIQKLVSYVNPVNQQRKHWVWDNNQTAEVDRDWGRYIILASQKKNVMIYDERYHRLAVPSTVPLPRFLARAVTLCTGMAPVPAPIGEEPIGGLPAGHQMDIYYDVTPPIAKMISRKLSQDLVPHSISSDRKGVIS
ncbi:MAG: hypothetical protein HF976_09550 [ANME-2 cluster archaeon]|nr:hypothetical protein [ANME-2 cluster archaeon]MBC2701639.1 hypothetical protein [ANME-2 cluster archaeon]MBC2708813.1 hypothetical protein [ANME-2 cluster archaeon]MBC2746483.1 hypothetical protein [ANME-2 cluster archaeon]